MSTDSISTWDGHWSKGDIPWQLPEVNPRLLANMEELIGRLGGPAMTNGEASEASTPAAAPARTILVPLCGKSKDLIHLYQLGHTVVGCEWVEAGCVQFFTDNSIPYGRTPLQHAEGSLFQVGCWWRIWNYLFRIRLRLCRIPDPTCVIYVNYYKKRTTVYTGTGLVPVGGNQSKRRIYHTITNLSIGMVPVSDILYFTLQSYSPESRC